MSSTRSLYLLLLIVKHSVCEEKGRRGGGEREEIPGRFSLLPALVLLLRAGRIPTEGEKEEKGSFSSIECSNLIQKMVTKGGEREDANAGEKKG